MKIAEPGPPIDEVDVERLETEVGHRFPDAYRSFLLRTNGGVPDVDTIDLPACVGSPTPRIFRFFSIEGPEQPGDLLFQYNHRWSGVPPHVLPIARTRGADKFCVDLRSGRVLFYDPYWDEPILYDVAAGFDAFTQSLYSDGDRAK